LESEAVRDAMLVASGALDRRPGGPPVEFSKAPEGQAFIAADEEVAPGQSSRRSVYLRDRRSEPITFLQTFDRAIAAPNGTRRASATVVSRALAMLNSRFVNATAERFAARLVREVPAGADERIRRAFLIAYIRLPGETELSSINGFLASQTARY